VTAAVWRMSGGNPLYVRELVRGSRRAGTIAFRDRVWRLDGRLEPGPSLAELLQERLDLLTPSEREALEIAAFADPVPLPVLLRLVSPAPVESLQCGGLLACTGAIGNELARPATPVIAALVRRAMPASRVAALGLALADAVEADGRRDSELVRVVTWRLDAGVDPGANALLRAGVRAARDQDWPLSARLAQAACDGGAGAEAVLALADALTALGHYSEALALLARRRDGNGEDTGRGAVLRASIQYFGLGQVDAAHRTLASAGRKAPDPSDRAWMEAVAAGLEGFSGRPGLAAARAEEILRRPAMAPRAETTARAVLSMGLAQTGHTEQALDVLDRNESLQKGKEVAVLCAWTLTARALAYLLGGRIESLERLSQSRYERAVERHDHPEIGRAAGGLGWAALAQGRLDRAVSWFQEATAAQRSGDSLALRVDALLGLAETLALIGDVDGARSILEEARPAAEQFGSVTPRWAIAAAWLAAANGAMSEALGRLDEAAGSARAAGQTAWEIAALQTAVRLGSATPARRLHELATWVEGPFVAIVAAHAEALRPADSSAEGSGDALDSVAERYARLGLALYAAEAAAQACRAHQSAAQGRRAAASAARGHFLLGSGDDGRPPLALALALTPPELTRREREVAMLAARGLSSHAIASRLCLSVRTVETHLARVYLKLGISGRSELAVALVSAASGARRVEVG
jgi:DNA-binding CsgD family transcriptional regulator